MTMVKRIAPVSAFKVGLAVYGLAGLVAGALCSAVAVAGGQVAAHAHLPGAWGLLALILCPMIWGAIGGVVTVVGALIYNLAAGWVGGLEVDIS